MHACTQACMHACMHNLNKLFTIRFLLAKASIVVAYVGKINLDTQCNESDKGQLSNDNKQ